MLKVSILEKHNIKICFDRQISNMNSLIFQVRTICFEQLQLREGRYFKVQLESIQIIMKTYTFHI